LRDLSLHLLDIIQNSVNACASSIYIEINAGDEYLEITIKDNGRGMTRSLLNEVTDPFVTTRKTRKVGLGIPLLKEACEITGGSLFIDSEEGNGTQLKMKMLISSIDRLPVGDIGSTFMGLAMSNPETDFTLVMKSRKDEYQLSFFEIRKHLDGVPLNEISVANWIKDNIEESKNYIFGGILNEITGTVG